MQQCNADLNLLPVSIKPSAISAAHRPKNIYRSNKKRHHNGMQNERPGVYRFGR
jgi:hypothetical protein